MIEAKPAVIAMIVAVLSQSAVCQTVISTKLEIRVMKRVYDQTEPKPFRGVGVFDLFRGQKRFDGASCPDRSDANGTVFCVIKCDANDKEAIKIYIQPPTNQDHLTGWVTPPGLDVELRGCKLSPSLVTARYDDARYALNNALKENRLVAEDTAAKNPLTSWKFLSNETSNLYHNIAVATETQQGRDGVISVLHHANEGARIYWTASNKLDAKELEEKGVLSEWETVSKSALLRWKVENVVPTAPRTKSQYWITTDRLQYLSNLRETDELLNSIENKTSEQAKFADDIKTLRSIPSTGDDSKRAIQIIEKWK
jgi:hypothetical protein